MCYFIILFILVKDFDQIRKGILTNVCAKPRSDFHASLSGGSEISPMNADFVTYSTVVNLSTTIFNPKS